MYIRSSWAQLWGSVLLWSEWGHQYFRMVAGGRRCEWFIGALQLPGWNNTHSLIFHHTLLFLSLFSLSLSLTSSAAVHPPAPRPPLPAMSLLSSLSLVAFFLFSSFSTALLCPLLSMPYSSRCTKMLASLQCWLGQLSSCIYNILYSLIVQNCC